MATSKKSAGSAKTTAKKAAPAKAAAKKAPATSATKSAGAGKSAAKSARTPNAAFMKPMRPDSALAAVVGNQPMPRSEITKRVWDYIKQHNLQDQQNKRNINADDKLKAVFGGKKTVTMFEMTKLVNGHLSEA